MSVSEASRRACDDDDLRRIAIEADDADVEVRGREQQPHLGAFGRRLPLLRVLLRERLERCHRAARPLADAAVDDGHRAAGRHLGGDIPAQRRRCARLPARRRGHREDCCAQEDPD